MSSAKPVLASDSRFVRRMIDSHSVLGLAFAALIYVVSITGAIVLFEPEIAVWENADAQAAQTTSPKAIAAGLNAMLAASGGPASDAVFPGVVAPQPFQPFMLGFLNERVSADSDFEFKRFILDPQTGAILQPYHAHLSEFLGYLHTDLHLPRPWGRYLVGLLGVCMFSLILSGIFAHPTILKDAFKLRLTSNTRMAWTDVHNRLSVWGLPFHMVLTFTGAFLGIAGLAVIAVAYVAYDGDTEAAVQAIRGASVIEGDATTQPPPFARMFDQLDSQGSTIAGVFVEDPFSTGGVTRFNMNDATTIAHGWSAQFRNTGDFLQNLGGKEASTGLTAIGLIAPLHFGTFGGYGIKALYFLLSLALTYITSTGMMIWFRRRAQQGNPVPRTQAAWHGMTTGLSFGLALATLAAATKLSVPIAPVALISWLAIALIIWRTPNPERLIKAAYVSIGALLIGALMFHVPSALNSAPALKTHLLVTDGVLLLIAVGFFWVGAGRDLALKGASTPSAVAAE